MPKTEWMNLTNNYIDVNYFIFRFTHNPISQEFQMKRYYRLIFKITTNGPFDK